MTGGDHLCTSRKKFSWYISWHNVMTSRGSTACSSSIKSPSWPSCSSSCLPLQQVQRRTCWCLLCSSWCGMHGQVPLPRRTLACCKMIFSTTFAVRWARSVQEQRPAESARPVPGPLEHLVSNSLAGTLRPARFFPSWSGVLTLAFTGWPPALAQLKANLNATLHALPNENPGSRWPKVSIGALRDGARLTPEQLQVLMDTCTSCSAAFTPNGSLLQSTVVVDALQVVMYQCRCLERVVVRHTIPLRSHAAIHEEPDVAEQARVAALVAEADSPGYWFHAAKDGNRETHYRGTALGVTLVHTLSLSANDAAGPLAAAIRAFRQRVDEVLPGLYTWFSDDSLHVTIRALMG